MLVEPEQGLPRAAQLRNLVEDQRDGVLDASIRVLLSITYFHEADWRADDQFSPPGFS